MDKILAKGVEAGFVLKTAENLYRNDHPILADFIWEKVTKQTNTHFSNMEKLVKKINERDAIMEKISKSAIDFLEYYFMANNIADFRFSSEFKNEEDEFNNLSEKDSDASAKYLLNMIKEKKVLLISKSTILSYIFSDFAAREYMITEHNRAVYFNEEKKKDNAFEKSSNKINDLVDEKRKLLSRQFENNELKIIASEIERIKSFLERIEDSMDNIYRAVERKNKISCKDNEVEMALFGNSNDIFLKWNNLIEQRKDGEAMNIIESKIRILNYTQNNVNDKNKLMELNEVFQKKIELEEEIIKLEDKVVEFTENNSQKIRSILEDKISLMASELKGMKGDIKRKTRKELNKLNSKLFIRRAVLNAEIKGSVAQRYSLETDQYHGRRIEDIKETETRGGN